MIVVRVRDTRTNETYSEIFSDVIDLDKTKDFMDKLASLIHQKEVDVNLDDDPMGELADALE